jgi:hypothetical protein
MLSAMDRDLAHHDAAEKGKQLYEYERHGIEDAYLACLVHLGDHRIASEMSRRSRSADSVTMRRKFAFAAHALGDPRPLEAFADDFAAGKIVIPPEIRADFNPSDQPATVELEGIISMLTAVRTDYADAALFALADPHHPQHDLALTNVRAARGGWSDDDAWFCHPYWVLLLRPMLENTQPTGARYVIENNGLRRVESNGSSSEGIPEFLSNASERFESAAERECDVIAQRFCKMLIAAPVCHPLLKDNPQRLASLRAYLDRFQRHFRLPTAREAQVLSLPRWEVLLIPDIPPLERPATDQDVQAGRALFNLPPGAKTTGLKLPALAFRTSAPQGKKIPLLIVQAEIGPDGKTTYGIISRSELGPVPAAELTTPQSLADMADPR